MTHTKIAIVGCGASSLYVLKELLNAQRKLSIVIYQSGPTLGPGMPYSSDQSAEYMLCNAFSKEIPWVTQSLVDWLLSLPARELSEWEFSHNDVHPRAFYPRVLIGEFLQSEFANVIAEASKRNCSVDVRCNQKVIDIGAEQANRVFVQTEVDDQIDTFDHVVIATGHVWAARPMIENVVLYSPWPHTKITELRHQDIGILGSSLSAIDVVIALGFSRGSFVESSGKITWIPNEDQKKLRIKMISKMGIMPEADFYYPYPYEPLKIITPEAVKNEVTRGGDGLLGRIFALLLAELDLEDPEYLEGLGNASRTIEGFADTYFLRRQKLGGLLAVKKDLTTARKTMRERKTVPHRYVLLRAHEIFDLALRSMTSEDWKLFKEKLLPVFADCYAAVPHLSVARVLALYDAGVLSILDTGEDAKFEQLPNDAVEVKLDAEIYRFDVLIDARGQASAQLGELPFPTLKQLLKDQENPIEAPFRLELTPNAKLSIYCIAMPQLLERYPFSQGLENCAEAAKIVVRDIISRLD